MRALKMDQSTFSSSSLLGNKWKKKLVYTLLMYEMTMPRGQKKESCKATTKNQKVGKITREKSLQIGKNHGHP